MLDLEAISEKWLNQCGPCDAGLPYECSHPQDDYRPVILDLVREVQQLRALGIGTPTGTEVREEWRIQWPDGDPDCEDDWLVSSELGSREEAEARLVRSMGHRPEGQIFRRLVAETPWLPEVTDAGA